MKILHITTHFNRGGITSYLVSLSKGLKDKGHSVVIASSGGKSVEVLADNNIEHLTIPLKTKSELNFKLLISYFILKKFIKENQIDVIHAHTRVAQVLANFLSKTLKIPFVATCHGFFTPRWHRKILSCWGNKTIAISNQVRSHLISEFKINEKNIHLVHNGVDLNRLKSYSIEEIKVFKKSIGMPDDCFVVGTAARFSFVKGLRYLLKAAPLVLSEKNNTAFLLVGYGEEELRLRQISSELNIDKEVFFLNPQKDSFEYLYLMDIFVMPSIQEGLGISILEAQAHKIPVVASNVGGIPDIIKDRITGLLVEPKNNLEIARAILELMNDNNLYSLIKNNAYDKVSNEFIVEMMTDKTEAVYKDLLCPQK
ncbi:MAG: glycosyltransferase family 4 protein [Candidatus Omnitrophota bacterium]